MHAVRRLLRGETPLATAFWDWAVIGGLAVNLSTTIAYRALLDDERALLAWLIGYGCSIPYNLAVGAAVWRAAARYPGRRFWAIVARILIVPWFAALSVT